MMRNKIKRILAMLLAVLMIAGTVYGDGSIGFRALAEVETSENDEAEAKIITFQASESIQGFVEGIGFNNLNCSITGKDVNGNDLGPFSGNYDHNTGKIEVTISNYSADNNYHYILEDSNYEIQEVNGTLNDTTPLLITKVAPKYGVTYINASSEELESGNAAVFTAGVTNAVWSDKITWTVSGDGASFVAFVNSEGTKIASTESVTGNSCTLSIVDSIQQENLPVSIVLTATDLNNGSINKQVTFKKISSIEISSVESEQATWNEPVTINAQVTPQEAGRVVIFYNNGTQIGESATDESGRASCSWTPSSGGQYEFTASVSGNDSYLTKTSGIFPYKPGTISQNFEVTESDVEVTYGDQAVVVATVTGNGDGITQDPTYEVSKLSNVAECWFEDGQVKITPLKAGKFEYQITKKGNESYSDAKKLFSVTINPKVLQITEISTGSKVYDGNTAISDLEAYLNQEDFVNGEALQKLTADGEIVVGDENKAKAANVGDEKKVAVTFKLPEDYQNKYVLKSDKEQGTEVSATTTANITKRKLDLKIAPATISCIDEINSSNLQFEDPKNNIEISNFVNGEEGIVESGDFKPPILVVDESQVNDNLPLNQEIADAVYAKSGTGNATDNYEFNFDTQKRGTLKLIAADIRNNISDYISIDNDNSTLVYQDMNTKTIYYRKPLDKETTVAKFKIADSKEDTFTKLVKVDDETESDVTENGLELTVNDEEQQTFRFKLSNDSGTKQTKQFDVEFIRDNTKPEIEIEIGGNKSVVTSFENAITFGIFSNREVSAEIKVNDPVDVNENHSGLKSWSYCVINTKEDVIFEKEEITKENVEEKFKGKFFINVELDKDGQNKEIPIGKEDEEVIADNYIVFVYAEDNVGNSVLYSSKGMVIDNVPLSQKQIIINNNTKSENKENYFKDNVKLDVTIRGNEDDVYSGVNSISYVITKDETLEKTIKEDFPLPDESISDLKDNYSEINLETIEIEKEEGRSKEVKFQVTATDFAHNLPTTNEKIFVIDPVEPKIVKQEYSSEAKRTNDKYYYNKNVVLTTEIEERFLDVEQDVHYIINGKEVSFKELEQKKSTYGILNIDYTQSNNDVDPDKNLTTIYVTFEADGEYELQTIVKDMAGNKDESESYSFVIDKTAPEVRVVYYDITKKEAFTPSKDGTRITYKDSSSEDGIEVKIIVDEKNFNSDECVKLNLTSVNSKNEKVELGTPSVNRVSSENGQHILSLTITKDANYTFNFTCQDLAGNPAIFDVGAGNEKETYKSDYFTLDRIAPEGKVTVNGLKNTLNEKSDNDWIRCFIEKITFEWFGQESVDVTMEGDDETSGVDDNSICYITTSKLLSKEQLAKREDWRLYTEAIPYEANKNIIVYERVEDKAGNYEYYSTDNIVIDNTSSAKSDISITVTPEKPKKGKGIYNFDEIKRFNISVVEPAVEEVYSGIKEIRYEIVDEKNNKSEKITEFDKTEHKKEYSEKIEVKPNKNYSSNYTITVYVEDWSGNTAESDPLTIIVDPVKPKVENRYESEATTENDYYNKDVRLTTTITERYLDIEEDVVYIINNQSVTLGDLISRKKEFGITESIVVNHTEDASSTDESTSTIELVFETEGNYKVSVKVCDKAGNLCDEVESKTFVIDKTTPKAHIGYYKDGDKNNSFQAGTEGNIVYLGEQYNFFQVEVTVDELNFTDNKTVEAEFTASAKKSTGDGILSDEIIKYKENAKGFGEYGWKNRSGSEHVYTVDITKDANYTFDFNYTDLAGNPVEFVDANGNVIAKQTDYITLDRVKPSGTITVRGFVNGVDNVGTKTDKSWIDGFIESISFGLFGKNDLSSSMEASDEISGVKGIEYLVDAEVISREALRGRTDWHSYTERISLAANQNAIVYEKVTDKAGNIQYYSTDSMIADNQNPAPVITITPSSPAWGKGVYSAGDRPGFDVNVTDPAVNHAYSGLQEITYQITNGTTGGTETGTLATFARNAHQQSWSGHVNIDPEKFYSNDVRITVSAKDWSTNAVTSEAVTLKIDNKAPIVQFSFDKSDAQNGKYYKNNKTLTITVNERNFDTAYLPKVTSSTGSGYSFSGWSSNGEIHTGVVTFSGDSDYSVTFDCYDLAGNKSNTETLEQFTVDKTLPVITVSYDNKNVSNGKYYKAERTATITITEHNFRASEVRVTTTASNNGSPVSAPSVSGWSTNGDRHTATIRFASDAEYTFDISYTDMAGNAAAAYQKDEFTVDLTNPELQITGVANKSANKGVVQPVITISDTNYTASGVSLTLTGANKGKIGVEHMVSRASSENGQIITFRNFGADMDDIYTLTAKITDKAGNESTRTITFSVNRNGSAYVIDDATQKLLKSGFTNNPKDIVIQEINVDTLEFIELSYSKDGKVVKLKRGTDYTVKEEGGNGEWKKYTYTIFASCFNEEGEYAVNIYSEDRAENVTTNKVKEKSIEFIVDKTAPAMVVTNLEHRGRYKENIHRFTLSVKDNTVLSYVELYLDGKLIHTYKGDELTVEDGVIAIDIDSKGDYQTVKLIAYDEAGNPTDPAEYSVLVTSNGWIQFYMNKPLFYGSIAAIAAAAGFLFFIFWKGRKKEEEASR